MAHEISIKANGRAEMAYVGETPWHGLGQAVTKGASIGVWMKEAGMDWEAREAAVQFCPADGTGAYVTKNDAARIVNSHKVLYRSDSQEALGIVGAGYNVVQPRDVLEFFRDEVERGGWYIHTAGVLKGGRKLWAMATNDQIDLVHGKGGDQVVHNLLLATSLDGSMKTVAKPCAKVVVCNNTLNIALAERGRAVTVSHRSVFDPSAIKRALGIQGDAFNKFIAQARDLSETPIALDEAMDVLERIFGKPPMSVKGPKLEVAWMGDLSKLGESDEDEEEDPRVSRSVSRCLELFNGAAIGADLVGRPRSRWGLLNSVTQYVDHEMGKTADSRIDQAWFGRGDSFKQNAFEVLTDTFVEQ